MKTAFLAAASALMVMVSAPVTRCQWQQLATMPTSRSLWGASFVSPSVGFVAGENHELHKTIDGGRTWTSLVVPGGKDDPIYNVHMFDASVGICSSNSTSFTRGIYRTTNGGASWQPASFPLGGSWYYLDFVSPGVGFAGSNGACVKTIDQGQTWVVQSGYPECPIMYSMDFLNEQVGLVGGIDIASSDWGLFKTTDGGRTWTLKRLNAGNGVIWLDAQTALADDGTHVVISTDAGESWKRTAAVIPTGLSDLASADGQTVVGVGFDGTIWRSTDRGNTFVKRVVGIGDLPGDWSVESSDASHYWVVGTHGIIYTSSDGGVEWTYVTRGIGANWYAMEAWSDRSVVTGGYHGYVSQTENAGATWTPQIAGLLPEFGRDTNITDMQMLSATSMVAVGAGGSFLKTTDRGRTWRELGYPNLSVDYYINGVAFTDELKGWIVGFDNTVGPKGYVRRTHDGGLSWATAEPNIPGLAIEFVGKRGYILTTSEPLWRTFDGGASWAYVDLPPLDGIRPSPEAMSWPSAEVGYVCGFFDYLAKTTDGGTTWTHLHPHMNEDWVNLDVVAPTQSEVWVVSSHRRLPKNRVMRSLDGGATWETWSVGGGRPVPTAIARTGTRCYVACFDGEVFKLDGLPRPLERLGRWPVRQ